MSEMVRTGKQRLPRREPRTPPITAAGPTMIPSAGRSLEWFLTLTCRLRCASARQAILFLSPTGRDGHEAPVRAKKWVWERRTGAARL
jgi:hypothetical protein